MIVRMTVLAAAAIAVLVGCAVPVAGRAVPAPNPAAAAVDALRWDPVTDDRTGVSGSLPGPTTTEPHTGPGGRAGTIHSAAQPPFGLTNSGFSLHPKDPTRELDLDATTADLAQGLGGEIVTATEVVVGGAPAMDARVEYSSPEKGERVVFYRTVDARTHVVTVVVSGPPELAAEAEAVFDRIASSLRLP